MTVDDPSGTVAIYKRGHYGLYADDHGLTYRLVFGTRRFAWAEVCCFQDGRVREDIYSTYWILNIVLQTGRKVSVRCPPTSETLAAIRQVAARYEIPAHLLWVDPTPLPLPLVGVVPERRAWVPKRLTRKLGPGGRAAANLGLSSGKG